MFLVIQSTIVLLLAAFVETLYITAVPERPLAIPLAVTSTTFSQPALTATVSVSVTSPPTITFSALITIAPLSPNPLEARQRCFNDQGFNVDCAVWTGYRYTWGGAGHPYAGGPGDGSGSGSGGGGQNSAITGIIGSANRIDGMKWPIITALATLCLLNVL